MYRDILVEFDDSAPGRARLDLALDLGRRCNGAVTGFHVARTPDVPPTVKPSRVAEIESELGASERQHADRAQAAFATHLGQRGVNAAWRSGAGEAIEVACEFAGVADLVVVGQGDATTSPSHDPRSLAEGLIQKSGRPVLVVPEELQTPHAPERAWLIWDGTPSAVRALHDSLPLLRQASQVWVTPAEELRSGRSEAPPLASLIAHMSRHGVDATEVDAPVRLSEPRELIAFVRRRLIDLTVVGAHRHFRWLEMLFGNPDEDLIRESRSLVLVAFG